MLLCVLTGPPRASDPIVPWSEVLGLFGLPLPEQPPTVVTGGWSHNVWRVVTPAGAYAVKEIVENPASWWIEQIGTAVAFEQAAWRDGTIAMAEPIPVAGSHELLGGVGLRGDRRCYRCHRWVDGRPCLDLVPDTERSGRVGAIVASLARLGVDGGTSATQLPWNALDAYDDTVGEAASKGLGWASTLADLRPNVVRLRRDFADLSQRAAPMRVLHRDIDPKNTSVRADNEVALFDWDYAGPRLLATEVLDAALSFAGGPLVAEESCVLAAVDGYRGSDGPPVNFIDAAAPLIEEGFRWIMLNAWRCLGHRGVSAEQRTFAGSLVETIAATWPDADAAIRTWAQRLADRVQ